MKYVKLTAKPDSWFKVGTEVYHNECNPPDDLYRVSLEEWEKAQNIEWGIICVRGTRIIGNETEAKCYSGKVGDERWDGELCDLDEFDMEVVEERK